MASRNVKVLVVGNPANTNAYIAMKSAPDLPREELHRHAAPGPQPRAASQIAAKTGKPVPSDIKKAVRGATTRPTMYADYRFATVDGAKRQGPDQRPGLEQGRVPPTVGKRGAAIIEARGLSSAASAANAAIDHMRDWALGTNGKWVMMGIPSNGRVRHPEGRDVRLSGHLRRRRIQDRRGLPIDAFSQECINKTLAELLGEQDGVKHL